jgi:hypothetical protein
MLCPRSSSNVRYRAADGKSALTKYRKDQEFPVCGSETGKLRSLNPRALLTRTRQSPN